MSPQTFRLSGSHNVVALSRVSSYLVAAGKLSFTFSKTAALLLRNSVGILETLDISRKAFKNYYYQREIYKMRYAVEHGYSLMSLNKKSKIFNGLDEQLINIGHEATELPYMLEKIAQTKEQELKSFTEKLTSLIEPVLILILGVIIGSVIIGLYLPVFELMNVIQ